MRRTWVLAVLTVALGAGGVSLFVWTRPAEPKPLASFLVIVVDSMRADHLGAYGYPRPTSPRLDGLARRGIVFQNAYAQAPWTKPSVASLFTSTYASVHRVLYSERDGGGESRSDVLNEKFLTLAEAMRAGGIATGGFGKKIHLRAQFGFAQGFDAYDMGARRAERVNRRALAWLRHRRPERFFIYLHYNDPHYPYKPEPGYARFGATQPRVQITGETKKAFRAGRLTLTSEDIQQLIDLYDGEILYTDHHIGELIDAIATMGYENLLVIVTADHGEEFLDHGDITHGQSLYGELVRVPFIVTGSGLPAAARGRRLAAPVQLIDIMPTLLQLAGLTRPPTLQGRSLVSLLEARPAAPATAHVFSQRREPGDPAFSEALCDGRWKLIRDAASGRTMLFDLASDPGETLPTQERNPQVVARLTASLEAWSEANGLLYGRIRPEQTTPLAPDVERRLRSLGYIN